MNPDHWLRYELAAVLGLRAPLNRLALALSSITRHDPAAPVVELEATDLAMLPVLPALAAQLSPDALRTRGLDELIGATRTAAQRRSALLTGPESGFTVLTPGLAAVIEAVSVLGPIAYIEADYVGLEGRQAAVVWQSGRLSTGPVLLGPREPFDPHTAPINVALRTLGVIPRARRDAFLVAGLDRHRSTSDWVSASTSTTDDFVTGAEIDDDPDSGSGHTSTPGLAVQRREATVIEWSDLVSRLKPGDSLQPLVGDSALTVESIDDEQICIRQRLWQACLTRADMQIANDVLAEAPSDVTPIQLAERIRTHFMSGHEVVTGCTRVPNLAAIVLYNLGAVHSE